MKFSNTSLIVFLTIAVLLITALVVYRNKIEKTPEGSVRYHWSDVLTDEHLHPCYLHSATFVQPDGVSIGLGEVGLLPEMPGDSVGGEDFLDEPVYQEAIPQKLSIKWFDIAARTWYEGEFKLPVHQIDSVFRSAGSKPEWKYTYLSDSINVFGLRLHLQLLKDGVVKLWMKGKHLKYLVGSYKGKKYNQDYTLIAAGEAEAHFADSLLAMLPVRERDELDYQLPWIPRADTTSIHEGVFEFIAIDGNYDDELLLLKKAKDTLGLINHFQGVVLNRGDRIRLRWKTADYIPAGDPESVSKEDFVVSYELIKAGRLSRLLKRGFPTLRPYYVAEGMSETGKLYIEDEMKAYLACSEDPKVRAAVDKRQGPMMYTIEPSFVGKRKVFLIGLALDQAKPVYLKKLYFDIERPYRLFETD
ncbi:hypothetical protein PBAL39_25565 [Pedobacter sp. BAL39]|uniref:hypothetical protein n=1 Tax=Pedobacter sp. BAL39 TaxID=391596 RepID=UPI000155963A|nr:hypothetical protein [Pedobacter sp. BAL39]EDM36699.1 hypothetical protein PBAL39_25565 [Pedobacter sp. BAL39]